MQVYIELAVLENFCMDFTLLYCAKLASKNRAGWRRIALASSLGAAFAVVFPLFRLGTALSIVLKIASGLLICLAAGRFSKLKNYLFFCALFFGFSALLAGVIVGVFSLAGVAFEEGEGYIYSSVPVGVPLFFALLLVVAARAIKNRFFKGGKRAVEVVISLGDKSMSLRGFFDSGNRVYHFGEPVSIIPKSAAEKLIDLGGIKDGVKIHTVAGGKTLKVFTADRLEINFKDRVSVCNKVKLGVSVAHIDCAVLHPDLLEE